MGRDCDVLIVGGGLNGPVLALALAQAGMTSIVLDAASVETRAEPGSTGGPMRCRSPRSGCSRRSGSGGRSAPHAQPIEAIRISDGRPGEGASRLFLHFDGQEVDEGPMGQIVEDRFLRARAARGARGGAGRRASRRRRRGRPGDRPGGGGGDARRRDRARRLAPRRLRRAGERGRGACRHRPARLGLRPDLAGLRGRARAAAPGGRAPVLHAGGAARHPAAARRPLVDRLDRAHRPRRGDRPARRRRLPGRAQAAVRRLPRRHRRSRAGASPIRSACRSPSAGRCRGSRWPATRRTASTRWRGRG